ncbi:hypothetical protein Sjap_022156 [Stephania japonica]|uniref:Uncharacterized protein n=1 Tax=Stephania japonica TaxID=461633 RepID=A0AAP0HSI7_9MAGN
MTHILFCEQAPLRRSRLLAIVVPPASYGLFAQYNRLYGLLVTMASSLAGALHRHAIADVLTSPPSVLPPWPSSVSTIAETHLLCWSVNVSRQSVPPAGEPPLPKLPLCVDTTLVCCLRR